MWQDRIIFAVISFFFAVIFPFNVANLLQGLVYFFLPLCVFFLVWWCGGVVWGVPCFCGVAHQDTAGHGTAMP